MLTSDYTDILMQTLDEIDRAEDEIAIPEKSMQVGGQVPQINRSGLIQGEGGPTSDSIPMQAEPNSFIINAPAVQMAGGAKKLDNMVQQQQQTSGFNQFGNPVTGSQDINVSNGEYKVSQPAAKKIGYKKLNKMNDAGKPFVDQIDQKGYAEGSQVPKPPPPKPGIEEMLTRLLISEAGGEGEEGMQLVANIIENRSKYGKGIVKGGGTEKNPTNLFDIISAGAKNKAGNFIYEFEGFQNKKYSDANPSDNSWKVANKIAKKLLSGKLKDITAGNLFYRNDKTAAKTGWFQDQIDKGHLKKFKDVGNHTIYEYNQVPSKSTPIKPTPPKRSVTVEPEAPANLSDTGFVNLPEEEGDIIRGTLGVPESPYLGVPKSPDVSPDENRLGRLPAQ